MEASSPINPHFFKPLLLGFHSHLNIPMAFFSKHLEAAKRQGKTVVKLRSDASDLTWKLKMEGRRLTQGWQKFATSHDLQVGDIVVFRYDGDLLFHVTSFRPSCCEIQYDNDDDVIQISSDSDSRKSQNTRDEEGTSSDNSRFTALVTASNLRNDILFLPIGFSRPNGLMNRTCEIILLNEDRKPWTLSLCHQKGSGRAYIRSGWRSFCFANCKRVNSLLTFELVQTSTTPVLQLCSSSSTTARSSGDS